MDTDKILFWNVDTQKDFIDPDGKLYVPGAELIKGNLNVLTELAIKNKIRVVNTADYHFKNSIEIHKNPDYVNTFPEHCMAETDGAEFIKETAPIDPIIFNWDKPYQISETLLNIEDNRNIVIRKDAFDVFTGSPHTHKILDILRPDAVYVYGVTTNICVSYAVSGLVKLVKKVFVIKDAIKELPGIDLPFEKWEKLNVKMINSNTVIKMFNK